MSKKQDTKPTILVAVDFSDNSREAVRLGARLAECMRQRLVILHVVHDPAEFPGYYASVVKKKRLDKLDDVAAEMLESFADEMRESLPDNAPMQVARTRLRNGLPVTQILEEVKSLRPTMLVMGSRGRTGLDHILLGSKAERCVQLCPVPVTIVKCPGEGKA